MHSLTSHFRIKSYQNELYGGPLTPSQAFGTPGKGQSNTVTKRDRGTKLGGGKSVDLTTVTIKYDPSSHEYVIDSQGDGAVAD